jgi:hypothetical protein
MTRFARYHEESIRTDPLAEDILCRVVSKEGLLELHPISDTRPVLYIELKHNDWQERVDLCDIFSNLYFSFIYRKTLRKQQ